ncbi:monovalent cation:H+ antiporter-2, CPA2 family [Gammaproteobacteria bacterium]
MEPSEHIHFSIFVIFTGSALLATLALYARQSLLVAYMLLGVLLGPWGLRWVGDLPMIQEISRVGITFLLFLLGLNLHPQRLFQRLREMTWVTLWSSAVFAGMGWVAAVSFGFSWTEGIIVGAASMFSSTIIGLKLLPTTVLHHQQTGRLIISILLLQDLIAILLLTLLRIMSMGGNPWLDILHLFLSLPILFAFAFLFERWVLIHLLRSFSEIHEYLFLAALGWCLGVAELSRWLGLSREIGAFVAGVAIATSPISYFISESLKPLRDFFLVIFFFTLGARFDLEMLPKVFAPAMVLTTLWLAVKPPVFRWLLERIGEPQNLCHEIGTRLGQGSEFSLLLAYLALELQFVSSQASYLIQAAAVLSLMASSYWIVQRLPTPIGTSNQLRQS